jgi:hypothetical protein
LAFLKEKILDILNSSLENSEANRKIDQLFSLDLEKIEQGLLAPENHSDDETYRGQYLPPDALYTSYRDLYTIFKEIHSLKINSFIDVGAGIGRSKLLMDALQAPWKSVVIEKVKERIQAGEEAAKKAQLSTDGFLNRELRGHPLPFASSFLIYLPTGQTLYSLLDKLKKMATAHMVSLFVIESHGDLIKYIQESCSWLEYKKELPLHGQRHCPSIFLFQSIPQSKIKEEIIHQGNLWYNVQKELNKKGRSNFRSLSSNEKWFLMLKLINNEELELHIQEDNFTWLGSPKSWSPSIDPNHFELAYPFRIVHIQSILEIIRPHPDLQKWREERFSPTTSPFVRKIILAPEAKVEFSDGSFKELRGGHILNSNLESFRKGETRQDN